MGAVVSSFEELPLELPDLRPIVDRRAVERWLERQGLQLADVTRPCNEPLYVEARRHIAKFLRGRGWSYPMIGKLLERDHTSVMHLVTPRHRP